MVVAKSSKRARETEGATNSPKVMLTVSCLRVFISAQAVPAIIYARLRGIKDFLLSILELMKEV